MPKIALPTSFYEDRSKPLSNQNLVNFYMNTVKTEGALSDVVYYSTPGLNQLATAGSTSGDIGRGIWSFDNIIYFVAGTSLYSLDRTYLGSTETFSVTDLGTISGNGRVSMSSNETQLMILVPGGAGYIYTTAGGLVTITDVDFSASGDPQYVVFADGYFICNTDEKKWIVSALNDGTSWNALDFSSAESDPDSIVAPVVNDNRVYIVGTQTTEGFQNIGGFGFPFQRDGTFLDKGCAAPFTLINANRSFFMVGYGEKETPAIWMFKGNDFNKISTDPIDYELSTYTDTEISNAFAVAWSQGGGYFVAFTFPSRTFVFNMVTNKWHEQTSFSGESESRWRVNGIAKAYGRIIAIDSSDGRIGELDLDTYGEYGLDIHSYFTTMPFSNDTKPVTVPYLELTCESGVGNSDVTEPFIYLATSRDSIDFSRRINVSLGKVGEREKRQIWHRNGRFSRTVAFRFGCTDQVKKVVMKLEGK